MKSRDTGIFEGNIPENLKELYSHSDSGGSPNFAAEIEAARIRAWQVINGHASKNKYGFTEVPLTEMQVGVRVPLTPILMRPLRPLTETQCREENLDALDALCERNLLEDSRVKAKPQFVAVLIDARDLLLAESDFYWTRQNFVLSLKAVGGDREALAKKREVWKRELEENAFGFFSQITPATPAAGGDVKRIAADAERAESIEDAKRYSGRLLSLAMKIAVLDQQITLAWREAAAYTGGKMRNKNSESNEKRTVAAQKRARAFFELYEGISGPHRMRDTIKEFRNRFDSKDTKPEERMDTPARRTAYDLVAAETNKRSPHAP